jgi:hypothetical protein
MTRPSHPPRLDYSNYTCVHISSIIKFVWFALLMTLNPKVTVPELCYLRLSTSWCHMHPWLIGLLLIALQSCWSACQRTADVFWSVCTSSRCEIAFSCCWLDLTARLPRKHRLNSFWCVVDRPQPISLSIFALLAFYLLQAFLLYLFLYSSFSFIYFFTFIFSLTFFFFMKYFGQKSMRVRGYNRGGG